MRPPHELLAENIEPLLRLRGWKQKDLAAKAEMAPGQLSAYLNGHMSPTLDALARLATALNVPIARLLGDHDVDECLRRVCEHVEAGKKTVRPVKKS